MQFENRRDERPNGGGRRSQQTGESSHDTSSGTPSTDSQQRIELNFQRNPVSEGPGNVAPKPKKGGTRKLRDRRLFSSDYNQVDGSKLKAGKEQLAQAVASYRQGEYFDALERLQKTVKTIGLGGLSESLAVENPLAFDIVKDCYLYSATCYIKIKQFDQAVTMMGELLAVDG